MMIGRDVDTLEKENGHSERAGRSERLGKGKQAPERTGRTLEEHHNRNITMSTTAGYEDTLR